jgi:hypothetical protein
VNLLRGEGPAERDVPAQSAARRGFTHAPPTVDYTFSLAGGKKSPDRLAGAEKADVRSIIGACMVAVSFSSVRLRTNRRRTPGARFGKSRLTIAGENQLALCCAHSTGLSARGMTLQVRRINNDRISMVGAVGIEPTTSPV